MTGSVDETSRLHCTATTCQSLAKFGLAVWSQECSPHFHCLFPVLAKQQQTTCLVIDVMSVNKYIVVEKCIKTYNHNLLADLSLRYIAGVAAMTTVPPDFSVALHYLEQARSMIDAFRAVPDFEVCVCMYVCMYVCFSPHERYSIQWAYCYQVSSPMWIKLPRTYK